MIWYFQIGERFAVEEGQEEEEKVTSWRVSVHLAAFLIKCRVTLFFIILFLPFFNFYGDTPRNCSFLKRRRAINLCGWDSSIPLAPLNSNNLRCSHQVSFVQFDFVQRGCKNEFNRCLASFIRCNFNVSMKRKRRSVLGMRSRKKKIVQMPSPSLIALNIKYIQCFTIKYVNLSKYV